MNNNTLIIASAGSGKTSHLVEGALRKSTESVLITTYTEANEREIRNKIVSKKGYVPSNITIQTWFSFLLQHGVRPYQSVLNDELHDVDIGFLLSNSRSGKKYDSEGNPISIGGRPIYWGEKDFFRYYFTKGKDIYSDKVSKFVCKVDQELKGELISRVSRIYKNIYIDEVQDLAGFDLDIIKSLFKSKSSVMLVGDPRQVTYLTHHTTKYGKYSEGNIKSFVENELGKRIKCEVDETTLSVSHRNNQIICDYSSRLYSNLPKSTACKCGACRVMDDHMGVFIVKPSMVGKYLETYRPIQLRWDNRITVNSNYPAMNFGESKGTTSNRVLIYPTRPMANWIKDNNAVLSSEGRAKLYVALTRARLSATIVLDYEEGDMFEGKRINNYIIA